VAPRTPAHYVALVLREIYPSIGPPPALPEGVDVFLVRKAYSHPLQTRRLLAARRPPRMAHSPSRRRAVERRRRRAPAELGTSSAAHLLHVSPDGSPPRRAAVSPWSCRACRSSSATVSHLPARLVAAGCAGRPGLPTQPGLVPHESMRSVIDTRLPGCGLVD